MEQLFTDNLRITEYLNTQKNTMVKTLIQINLEERVMAQIHRIARAQLTALNERMTDHCEIFENRLDEIEREDETLQKVVDSIKKKGKRTGDNIQGTDDPATMLNTRLEYLGKAVEQNAGQEQKEGENQHSAQPNIRR